MTTYAHKQIIAAIDTLDQVPQTKPAYSSWIRAQAHLDYLKNNSRNNELIIFGLGPCSFIYSAAIPADALAAEGPEALLRWNGGPNTGIASFVSGGGRDTMWIERGRRHSGSAALDAGVDLIFSRTFEGWSGSGRTYIEVNQEYAHLSGIHWRPERGAYCRFDGNGDVADIVSVTIRENDNDVTLVTFDWSVLEEYLSIGSYILVRMFDFTLFEHGHSADWGDDDEKVVRVSDDFLYRQKVIPNAAYTRGLQIIRPRDARTISKKISRNWSGHPTDEYVTFVADDWRHKSLAEMSTDPSATTNYFEAPNNDLPYELSIAFFRPEVLSKYKTDREKYTVSERRISCRATWRLRGYDVNNAGQVSTYICYLRDLPYNEQLHWKSYNEEPKAPISERALANDFRGEFVSFQSARAEILSILQHWRTHGVKWWTLRDDDLLHRANPPLSSSKDEWADAVMDLSKLVVEGFEVKPLRAALTGAGQTIDPKDQTVALLEKVLVAKGRAAPATLQGLRRIQHIRSKVKGHSGSSEGKAIAEEALAKHGTYGQHFNHICEQVIEELRTIQSVLAL